MTKTIQILNISQEELENIIERSVAVAMKKRQELEEEQKFNNYPQQMNRHQVADALGVHPNYVNSLAKQGAFTRVKVSPKKSYYIRQTVEDYWKKKKA